jgi:sortase A
VAGTRRAPRKTLRAVVHLGGELLITAGLVMLLYLAWELWWTNIESDRTQDAAVQEFLSRPDVVPEPGRSAAPDRDYGPPPVLSDSEVAGQTFGVMYVPRFGADYSSPVTDGVGLDVLDNLGLGHYPDTALPGEVGNFAVAGHRQTHGEVLDAVHTLVPGDKIHVQTKDGYYTYVYRNSQIVLPHRTDVIAPVPAAPDRRPGERVLTMTTCNPRFGSAERIAAYAVLDSWRPASAGPPADIADQVARATKGSS